MVLALIGEHFYPCLILRPSKLVRDGYVVFSFHYKEEVDIPCCNIIGNLKHLLNCEVSYVTANGAQNVGLVMNMDSSGENGQPMSFCVRTRREMVWVSVPDIYMTTEQVKVLL